MTVSDVVFSYVCPSLGCILSAAMYSAAVPDLQEALSSRSLGPLNPVPWAIMTGNCLGWCAYGYYNHDPFMLASNLPGLVLSVWLNMGAAKLQYQERVQLLPRTDSTESFGVSNADGEAVIESEARSGDAAMLVQDKFVLLVPQETLLLRVLVVWIFILIVVGWSGLVRVEDQPSAIGILVNINLIFFYGAPLQTMQTVLRTKSTTSIHRPTMIMNSTNAIFWLLYGIKKKDPYIFGPNIIGFLLGFAQTILLCWYGKEEHDGLEEEENALEEPLLTQEQHHVFDGNEAADTDPST